MGPHCVSNDDLLRFVDGELDDDGRVRVLTHLASRPHSVERVEAYLHQNARLRALRENLPLADSRDFAASLQAAIVERLSRHRSWHAWRRAAVAATVALALAGGVVGLALQPWREAPQTAAIGPVVPQAYFLFGERGLGTVIDPSAAQVAPPTVDLAAFDWLADRATDVVLTTPDLDSVGLALINGEVLDQKGSPAIRAVYRDAAGKPVVLFAGIGKPDVQHAFWLEREGYVSLQWRRGPMIFALVAPTDSPQLSAIVDLVSAAVAGIVLPAGTGTDTAQSSEAPAMVQPSPVHAVPAQAGPVQSIAVPASPVVDPTAASPVLTDPNPDPDTIHPDTLAGPTGGNAPEPL